MYQSQLNKLPVYEIPFHMKSTWDLLSIAAFDPQPLPPPQLELHVHLVPRAGRERDGDGDGHDDAAADHREPAHQPLHETQAPVQGDGGPVKVSGGGVAWVDPFCAQNVMVVFVVALIGNY